MLASARGHVYPSGDDRALAFGDGPAVHPSTLASLQPHLVVQVFALVNYSRAEWVPSFDRNFHRG